jgi:hypothetical protein
VSCFVRRVAQSAPLLWLWLRSKIASAPDASAPSGGTSVASGHRYEWFHLQYDRIYSPHCVYHMELKWLVATGMHVEAWLRNIAKKADTRFGLHLVKIPTNQPLRTADSFHVPVPMHIPDPYVLRLVEEFVIAHCGFVMDSELLGSATRNKAKQSRAKRRTAWALASDRLLISVLRTPT